ncbi:hypothetical protein D3C75_1326880 [compost metagenome]
MCNHFPDDVVHRLLIPERPQVKLEAFVVKDKILCVQKTADDQLLDDVPGVLAARFGEFGDLIKSLFIIKTQNI